MAFVHTDDGPAGERLEEEPLALVLGRLVGVGPRRARLADDPLRAGQFREAASVVMVSAEVGTLQEAEAVA